MFKQEQLNTGIFFQLMAPTLACVLLLLNSSLLFANDSVKHLSPKTTTVYKVTHPDGSVTYSDQAQTNAVTMEVAPVATIPAYKAPTQMRAMTQDPNAVTYESITIISPSNNSAFHSGSGNVDISTKIEPALNGDDLIRFSLDGVEVASQTGTTLQLNNVYRGTHTITVDVIDSNKNVLISTSSQFTIHRPINRSR